MSHIFFYAYKEAHSFFSVLNKCRTQLDTSLTFVLKQFFYLSFCTLSSFVVAHGSQTIEEFVFVFHTI